MNAPAADGFIGSGPGPVHFGRACGCPDEDRAEYHVIAIAFVAARDVTVLVSGPRLDPRITALATVMTDDVVTYR